MALDSDLSVAAGVTAKDKRAKDAKNFANLSVATPQLKKKRYASIDTMPSRDVMEGRSIWCDAASDQPLPMVLSLGQVLRMMEMKGMQSDWPCIHLRITRTNGIILLY